MSTIGFTEHSVGASGGSELRLLNSVALSLLERRSVDERLNEACRLICQELGLERAAIFIAGEGHSQLVARASYGLSPSYIELINHQQVIPISENSDSWGPTTRAYKLGRAVVVDDVQKAREFAPWQRAAREEGYLSIASFPLISYDKVVGVLNLYSSKKRIFKGELFFLLSLVANFVGVTVELSQLYSTLAQQYSLLLRSQSVHSRLMRVVLDDLGLQQVALALQELLHGEVVILDQGLIPRASTDEGLTGHLLSRLPELLSGREPPPKPLRFRLVEDREGPERETIVAPVVAGAELFGYVAVSRSGDSFDIMDERTLEQGATVVALEFSKLRKAEEVELRLKGQFLYELLSAQAGDLTYLRQRALKVGYPPDARYVVILATARDPSGKTQENWMTGHRWMLLRAKLENMRCPALVGEKGNVLIILCALQSEDAAHDTGAADVPARELFEVLNLPHPAGCLQMAIGQVVDTLADVRRSYEEATRALDIAHRLGRGSGVTAYHELGIYRLLMDTRSPNELADFARRVLGPALAYDKERASQLVPTLDAFLQCNASVEEAALKLCLHPNTVRYRLQKLRQVCHHDPFSITDLMPLSLATCIWRLTGTDGILGREILDH